MLHSIYCDVIHKKSFFSPSNTSFYIIGQFLKKSLSSTIYMYYWSYIEIVNYVFLNFFPLSLPFSFSLPLSSLARSPSSSSFNSFLHLKRSSSLSSSPLLLIWLSFHHFPFSHFPLLALSNLSPANGPSPCLSSLPRSIPQAANSGWRRGSYVAFLVFMNLSNKCWGAAMGGAGRIRKGKKERKKKKKR